MPLRTELLGQFLCRRVREHTKKKMLEIPRTTMPEISALVTVFIWKGGPFGWAERRGKILREGLVLSLMSAKHFCLPLPTPNILCDCNEGTKTNSEWPPVYLDKTYLSTFWKQLLILSISIVLGIKDMCLLGHYPPSASDQPLPVLLKVRLSLYKDLSKDYQGRWIRICGLIQLMKGFLPHYHYLHFNSKFI